MLEYSNIVAIHQLWQWYVTEGPGDVRHAASWELCVALHRLLDTLRPRSIADTGSGLTSILMQQWAHANNAECAHYDDDDDWATLTRDALRARGLDPGLVKPWAPLTGPVDLLVHDLGNPETRAASMSNVCGWARTIVVDDLHFDVVRHAALSSGRRFSELRFTRDGYGRWAGVSMSSLVTP